jgi:putative hemolysin
VPEELCADVQAKVEDVLGVGTNRANVSFTEPVSGEEGSACAIEAHGTGEDFPSPADVISALRGVFAQMGWQEDVNYQAEGPTGEATAFRQGDRAAFLLAQWKPSEDADCPEDQPISACDLKPEQKLYTVTVHLVQGVAPQVLGMPNPASQYCVEQGGRLEVRTDAQGNQFGVCIFPDGSECEEWAFFRGECQPGQQPTVPTRIAFEPGATSAAVEGQVPDQGKVVYVLRANEGQLLIVDLSTPRDDVFLGIVTGDGYPLVRPVAEAQHWSGVLPVSGDYRIEVVAMGEGAPLSLFVQIPAWLTFPEGSDTATVSGEIRHGQMVDYLLEGKQGQRLKVKVESPNQDVLLNIVALENGVPLLRYVAEATEWEEVLPFTDRYLISVFGGTPDKTTYTMTVTLEGAGEIGGTYDDPLRLLPGRGHGGRAGCPLHRSGGASLHHRWHPPGGWHRRRRAGRLGGPGDRLALHGRPGMGLLPRCQHPLHGQGRHQRDSHGRDGRVLQGTPRCGSHPGRRHGA